MNRDHVVRAYNSLDYEWVAQHLKQHPPLRGYDMGYNLAHIAVLTRDTKMVKLTATILKHDWDGLLGKENAEGQTPADLAKDLEYSEILELLESPATVKDPKVIKKKPHPFENMPIEQELEETKLDKFGQKCKQKLNANNNGKPFAT